MEIIISGIPALCLALKRGGDKPPHHVILPPMNLEGIRFMGISIPFMRFDEVGYMNLPGTKVSTYH